MTTKTNTERALPFAAAATLAVLLMALVVSPLGAQGGTYNPCTACINWVATSPNSPCYGLSNSPPAYNSPYNVCKNQQTQAYCNMTTSPFVDAQGVPPCQQRIGSGYRDCGSPECNFYSELPDTTLCNWECWNRTCDSSDSAKVCLDTLRKCKVGEASSQCADCKCVITP